ncbi:cathepsin B [Elysia marginata]|uniref:Cathepsin B n=1 Tax=Elysia marginata TaxID=1093978 RepID=A0AAV4IUN0_9GAST|nr:cathepsin B [Elysia marginata]
MELLSAAVSLAGIFAVALSATVSFSRLSDAEIEYINSLEGNTWKAGRNFDAKDYERVRNMLGVGVDIEANALYNKLHLSYPELVYPDLELPATFDAREQWPDCPTIKQIGDQSDCGSCWTCDPYEIPPTQKPSLNHTDNGMVPTPKCTKMCLPGYPKTWEEDKHFGQSSYGVQGVETIMQELVTRGPISAAFRLYSDLLDYKSGVYKHFYGYPIGGHGVKILGYGKVLK